MLEHWLQPTTTPLDGLTKEQLGRKITHYTEGGIPNLKTTQIALIGIGSEDADAVRTELYRLSCPFEHLEIVDLGNLRKHETSFITPLLAELQAGGITPVIIGFAEDFTLPQFQAFIAPRRTVSIAIVDERIRFSPKIKAENYYLHHILEDTHLFNCALLGFQAHFVPPSVIERFEEKNYEMVRLGKSRAALEDIEPLLRDADLLSFNLSALKMNEAPAQLDTTPSGYTCEEACLLTRYAGMSDKLSSLGIYGFRTALDHNRQTAQVVAQMVWYFLDGFAHRQNDFPNEAALEHLTQYVVDIKSFDYRITFWRSPKSGRWWMEIPLKVRRKHERHRLIPCSYNDYLQACNDDLPERLVNGIQRFK
jgi:formiminoglutamase